MIDNKALDFGGIFEIKLIGFYSWLNVGCEKKGVKNESFEFRKVDGWGW